jgi:hypothetical protein
MRTPLLLVALLALAGCASTPNPPTHLSTTPTQPAAKTAVPTIAVKGFASACPGETGRPQNATCTVEVSLVDAGLTEPAMAVDPTHPERLALVVNAKGLEADPRPATGAFPSVLHLEMFTSVDAGMTWTRSALPAVDAPSLEGPIAARISYDGSVAFGTDGTLHLAGIASQNGGNGGCLPGVVTWPFETHSSDLGKTWSKPHILENVPSDRTWLTATSDGMLYVNWRLPCETAVHAARTQGTDAAWEVVPLPCRFNTPFAQDGDRVRMGCVDSIASWGRNGTPAAGAKEPTPGYAWQVGKGPDGTWTLFTEDFSSQRPLAAWAAADLAKWTAPINLLTMSPWTAGWQSHRLFAAGVDEAGIDHAILVGSDLSQQCDPNSSTDLYRETPGGCDVVHLAFVPMTGALLDARLLASGAPENRTPTAPMAGIAAGVTGDDYAGLVFAGGATYVAWAREGAIEITQLVPLR